MQVRGDWSWLRQTFNFPSWSNKQIWWRCKANSDEFDWRDPSANARWRSQRLTEKQFFKLGREQSIPSNPIFELPHIKLDYVAIDALHALDLGFSQDVVGNVVWEFIRSVAEGRNLDLKVKYVWALLQKHFSEMKTAQKLQGLTLRDGKVRCGPHTHDQMPRVRSRSCLLHAPVK